MTPRLLNCREGETKELSMVREKVSTLEREVLVPLKNFSFVAVKLEEV